MADNEALIPYPHHHEIVLRQRDQVVVYDPTSKQLEVRNASSQDLDGSCPYCHRPLHDDDAGDAQPGHSDATSPAAASFASPEYFRMLQHSHVSSEESSRQASPRRRLINDLRTGLGTPPRAPPDAEFIGSSPAPQTPTGISATAFSPNYFHRFFKEERELGRGGKGVVLLVKHELDGVSLGHFALKRIPVGDDHQWLEKVLIEVQLLQHLSHQNLVSYRHVWLENFQISKFGPSVPCAFVLQQYCNSGDLHSYILQGMETTTTKEQLKERMRRKSRQEEEPLPESVLSPRKLQFDEIRAFFKDITAGLNHLHQNNYIHRDLKPSNCLLHDSGKGLRVLVSDFGEVQSQSQVRNSSGSTGTISYCAPEVLRIDPATGQLGNFSTKSDIFSLGLILYFMCFARLPYTNADHLHEENEDMELLREEILAWAGVDERANVRLDLPDRLFEFLGRLLSLDPAARFTSEETLQAIKTGAGIEGFTDGRSRSAEGLRRRSRFSPLESSAESISERTASASSRSRRFSRPEQTHRASPPASLELSPRRQPHPRGSVSGSGPASWLEMESEQALSTGATPLETSIPATASDLSATEPPLSDAEVEEPLSPGSLILHSASRHASPTKLAPSAEPLLPEPPPRWGVRLAMPPELLYTLKIASLLTKIFTIYIPCQPVATRPDVGLVLLGLATLDLLWPTSNVLVAVGLLALHVLLVGSAWWAQVLCLPRGSLWQEV